MTLALWQRWKTRAGEAVQVDGYDGAEGSTWDGKHACWHITGKGWYYPNGRKMLHKAHSDDLTELIE